MPTSAGAVAVVGPLLHFMERLQRPHNRILWERLQQKHTLAWLKEVFPRMDFPLQLKLLSPRRSFLVANALAALSLALGCASDDTASRGNGSGAFAVDSVPVLDIGDEADGSHAIFSGPVLPVFLSDGRIVVANGGSQELRFFDKTGTWIRSIGRSGSGPGEFNSLGWLHVGTADSLLTYDWGQLRVSVFSPDGQYERSYMLGPDGGGGTLRPQAALANGAIIASTQSSVDMSSAAPGVRRDTSLLLLFDAQGRPLDSLGRFPGSEAWIDRTERSMSVQNRPFGKQLTVRAHANAVYVGSADTHEITVLESSGRAERTLRWSGSLMPISPPVIDAYVTATVADAPSERRAAAIEMLRRAPYPPAMPAFATFVVADDGTVWVGRYLARGQGERRTFDVLDASGTVLGSVEMPARFSPSQVTRDRVIGTWRDEDDVVHIRVYRFLRAQ